MTTTGVVAVVLVPLGAVLLFAGLVMYQAWREDVGRIVFTLGPVLVAYTILAILGVAWWIVVALAAATIVGAGMWVRWILRNVSQTESAER